jgi:hypothetical protein
MISAVLLFYFTETPSASAMPADTGKVYQSDELNLDARASRLSPAISMHLREDASQELATWEASWEADAKQSRPVPRAARTSRPDQFKVALLRPMRASRDKSLSQAANSSKIISF